MRPTPASEMPTTMPYCGLSRCQPIGVPGRYSLTSTWTKSAGASPRRRATFSRSPTRNGGSGPLVNAVGVAVVVARRLGAFVEVRDPALREVLAELRLAQRQRRDVREQRVLLVAREEVGLVDEPLRQLLRRLEEPALLVISCHGTLRHMVPCHDHRVIDLLVGAVC